VIISIAPPAATTFNAVGVEESTSPAAEPAVAIVIPAPVIAVPPNSKDIPASPTVMAVSITVYIASIY